MSDLEDQLEGATRESAAEIAARHGVDTKLLQSAVLTRRELGRINDLIHAATIVTLLPSLLEDGEFVRGRPSLAAGNDPSRPYDLETNLRVAEFKFSEWKGADAMRKRGVFQDLVHLAAHGDDRRPELYVIGARPIKFLRQSTAQAGWALDRSRAGRLLFEQRFGALTTAVAEFTQGPGSRVELIRLEEFLPLLLDGI